VDPAIRGAAAIGHRTYGKDLRSIHSAVFLKTLKEARERAGVTQYNSPSDWVKLKLRLQV
jgi:hypothetical protein